MTKQRYFTKSLHKKALECPTKLYYHAQPDVYENRSLDDPFLRALAYGGFQVGELARIYFPGGIEVESLSPDAAVAETEKHLEKDEVTLFEAAVRSGPFLIRADVLVKSGSTLRLYEVKAKSIHPDDEDDFYDKRLLKKNIYKLKSKWDSYFQDIAFQTMVCQKAFPSYKIVPHLIFADKSKLTSVSGLNQRFLIAKGNGRNKIKVAEGTSLANVGQKILYTLSMSEHVTRLLADADFQKKADAWAAAYRSQTKLEAELSKACSSCEYRSDGSKGLKSGFHECWKARLKKDPEPGRLVIDLWNYRDADRLIAEGRLWLHEITEEDLKIDGDDQGLTTGQRQWLQVEGQAFADHEYLRQAMDAWKYPLHCIDFETTAVAIPFHEGRRPYEQIAFQFSHHIIHEDGQVIHAGEYLHAKKGEFPNFAFVRALKKELEGDQGSIFRYSNHENTILCAIHEQLRDSQEADKDELMQFIRTITKSGEKIADSWHGARCMIDLLEIVKKAYYNPLTKGSNSIKKVLPAVLEDSQVLQKKYSQPIYGGVIASRNFKNHTWLQKDAAGRLLDPYKQLPPLFTDVDPELLDTFLSDADEVADGGAAMMAFARMQFSEMNDLEFESLRQGLLRYCELDTLAMVMLIEHFQELLTPAYMSWGIISR
ncbi:MAG TPA: DUF2779 domain-containing protein [Oligoflexus sp.]|uniref:DUF2779 domain-containing protein n=1 Tax=Oligoflexus sp. TaxID=1971216 RepID=UPI002D7FD10F|nr:DUF2779 domain-containing protein [Oligoflexus sp.]HET9236388.1 DUF2779 domain-containing protein [Oligoflexus sp.]